MPNHIKNRLQITGEKIEIKKLLTAIRNDADKAAMDFNKIIQMPESLTPEIHSGIETAVKVALKMSVSDNELLRMLEIQNRNKFKSPLEFTDADWQQYIQCLTNVRTYGFIYWYDWAIANWGTKWNAYSQNDKNNNANTIYFETAWSSPIKLMQLLSTMFPQVKLLLTYADEDGGSNTGKIEFQNGERISSNQPESGTKEGYDIFFELNPDSVSDYEFVNGKYKYINS